MALVSGDLGPSQSGAYSSGPAQWSVRKRRCFECGAFLSRYNRSEKYCFIHELSHAKRFTW
jgi:hypothetical protein